LLTDTLVPFACICLFFPISVSSNILCGHMGHGSSTLDGVCPHALTSCSLLRAWPSPTLNRVGVTLDWVVRGTLSRRMIFTPGECSEPGVGVQWEQHVQQPRDGIELVYFRKREKAGQNGVRWPWRSR
jgi:hypothetical protein